MGIIIRMMLLPRIPQRVGCLLYDDLIASVDDPDVYIDR